MDGDHLKTGRGDRRSGRDRRSEPRHEQSDVAEFLSGQKVRFAHPSALANDEPKAAESAPLDSSTRKESTDRRSVGERRSGRDRRSGFDSRSEIERFMQGERRSRLDRRSKGGYRSFKQARAFVRDLKLKSVREWQNYIKADMKPDDIPDAPDQIYANDGWAGWGDWLGTARAATYFKQT